MASPQLEQLPTIRLAQYKPVTRRITIFWARGGMATITVKLAREMVAEKATYRVELSNGVIIKARVAADAPNLELALRREVFGDAMTNVRLIAFEEVR
jgi:hypothetical protein